METVYKNFKMYFEGITDVYEKRYHRGKVLIEWEKKMIHFIADLPRKRGTRNRKVYQDLGVRVMQCPDGSYVMTVAFEWQGTNTWNALMQIVRNVYQALKSL